MAMTVTDLQAFAESLPEAKLGDHGHRPAYRAGGKLFLVIEADSNEALLCVDRDERDALVAEAPDALREIRNKSGKLVEEWIKVDLGRADPALVFEVIEDAFRRFAPKRAIAALDRLKPG